jgi:hypothetical protein
MKKTFLILLTSGSVLLATACNSTTEHAEHGTAPTEAAAAHSGEGDAEHAHMSDMSDMSDMDGGEMLELETVAALADASPEAQQHIQALTQAYLTLKNALVQTNAAEAKTAAEALLASLNGFDAKKLKQEEQARYTEQAEALRSAGSQIAGSTDIKKQREQFVQVTKSIYALNKAFDANQSTLYYQYCPMAFNNTGGYWLSAEQEIRNPYFGDKMLKCGRVAETL